MTTGAERILCTISGHGRDGWALRAGGWALRAGIGRTKSRC